MNGEKKELINLKFLNANSLFFVIKMKIQAKNQNDQTDASKCGKPLLKNQNKPKGRKFGKNITLEASNKGKKNPIKTSVNEKTETCTK